MNLQRTAISLFCSAGIADLALRTAGYKLLVANELLSERAELFRENFSETKMIQGDIRAKKSEIIQVANELLEGQELDLLFATPPCQGMSKNGRGKLLSAIRAGKKPQFDVRNQLIVDTIDVVLALRPLTVLVENWPAPGFVDTRLS